MEDEWFKTRHQEIWGFEEVFVKGIKAIGYSDS
jgi:hypothetical protein